MARCPFWRTEIDPRVVDTVAIDKFVDAWLCLECDAILGTGEIRGER
jgi:hypothetical protein